MQRFEMRVQVSNRFLGVIVLDRIQNAVSHQAEII
jgi:hypothetical protein